MTAKAKKARAKKGQGRFTRELLETARDMRASGLMTKAAHDKITKRHLGATASPATPERLTGRR